MVLSQKKNILQAENIANIEINKIETWAKNNKIEFNENKSKLLVITRRRPRNYRDIRIYLNNKQLLISENIRYLGVTLDRKFNFNKHIEYVSEKCTKLIHSLSKSARVNWGLKSDVLKIIYRGAILPLLSYAAPVWIDSVNKRINTTKLRRVQRLINIKIIKAYRTTSYEASCIIAGLTPITIELQKIANFYKITRATNQISEIDSTVHYTEWPHPADIVKIHRKDSTL